MAENETVERARKELEKERELLERSREEYAQRMQGKPTPTQEENDLAALGAHITEHEDDGSGPDPFDWSKARERQLEGGKPASYQTRSMSGSHQTRPTSTVTASRTTTHSSGHSSS